MILLCASVAWWLWATPITAQTVQPWMGGMKVSPDATQAQLWVAVFLNGLSVPVLLWIMNEMRKLFARYSAGQVLTQANAQLILRIGHGLLWLAVLPIIMHPIQSVVLSWANPEGERVLSVGVSSGVISAAMAAGLLVLIGWAMRDAAEIADENRAFV